MIDTRLQMFISTCCRNCTKASCEGAYNIEHRSTCKKYFKWLQLSEVARSKLFVRAEAGEFITLEKITNGNLH